MYVHICMFVSSVASGSAGNDLPSPHGDSVKKNFAVIKAYYTEYCSCSTPFRNVFMQPLALKAGYSGYAIVVYGCNGVFRGGPFGDAHPKKFYQPCFHAAFLQQSARILIVYWLTGSLNFAFTECNV